MCRDYEASSISNAMQDLHVLCVRLLRHVHVQAYCACIPDPVLQKQSCIGRGAKLTKEQVQVSREKGELSIHACFAPAFLLVKAEAV